jgi:UDP-N-acetylglucosamine:LPS N-acetylglucosamine transferase
VVILTAGIGAGHDGAARAWAERLGEAGYSVRIDDLLGVLRRRRRPRIAAAYEAVMHRAPWAYQALFTVATRSIGVVVARCLMGGASPRVAQLLGVRRRLRLRTRTAVDLPDAVLCTYPLAGHVLGDLRRRGRLQVPVLTFLTDFSVHRLCVAPGVDAHLAVHRLSAGQAEACGGRPALVSGPVVGYRFHTEDGSAPPAEVQRLRERFGLPRGVRLALLVAGSWGVGEVETTATEIAATSAAVPVVVCGRNDRLRARIETTGVAVALGWVSDMPALMRCVDVLVENAGGLTSLEAMAAGLPVMSYRPIAGHGRANAEVLAAAGVASYVRSPRTLAATLLDLTDGQRGRDQRVRARAQFALDPVQVFRTAVDSVKVDAVRVAAPGARPPTAVRVGDLARRAAVLILIAAVAALGGNSTTELAVAHGVRAVRPSAATRTSYLVVRPGTDTDLSGRTEQLLRATSAAVAVDRRFAVRRAATVRTLAADGVPILVTEPDRGLDLDEVGSIRSGAAMIRRLTGASPTLFVPNRRVDAVDLTAVTSLHARVVQPRVRFDLDEPITVGGSQVVLIDCSLRPHCDLAAMLTDIARDADRAHVPLGSIAELADEPRH